MLRRPSSVFLLLFAAVSFLSSQEMEFLHTELKWRSIETPHFVVHYHEGAEWTAGMVAAAAESAYVPITTMYRHEPDSKVTIVVKDHDDYSNGAAYFLDNRIEIWAPAMDFDLRGIHPWIRNVVTHELTHIVQIQTAMKLGRRLPAFYLQWFGYESERRPDVLYGFPNVLVSYPLSAFLVPSWFAEGAAQYNHPSLLYDFWDSHRDMILRMHLLDGTALGWEDMAVFGKTSLGNESAYNAGFSLVEYIAQTYGAESLEAISQALGDLHRITIDGAIEKVLGKSGEELFAEWKSAKSGHYQSVRNELGTLTEGRVIESEGFGNAHPVFSPDGSQIAYVSNKGADYFGESDLYLRAVSDGKTRRILSGVRSALSFGPDGKSIYFSRISPNNPHWSRLSDLYRYDLETEEEVRLTRGLRAMNPSVSPDGKRLAFVFGSDGTMNLGTCAVDGSDIRRVTDVPKGHQVYTPRWSPDGSAIVFGYSRGHGQIVARVPAQGGALEILVDDADSRNPAFSSDGTKLMYSSDRSGIFNIYELDLGANTTSRVTNVIGGAFSPSVSRNGDIVFASYTSSGFKIAVVGSDDGRISVAHPSPTTIVENETTVGGPPDSREYRNSFTSLTFIPFLRVDNYNPRNSGLDIIKPGLYGMSYDMLNKLSLFGGAAINRKLERDLFLIFEIRDKLPLFSWLGMEPALSLELFNISRKTTSTFTIDPSPVLITPEITYNLLEFTAALRQPLLHERLTLRTWYTLGRYSADIGSFVNPTTTPASLVPAFRSVYFIGNSFNAQINLDQIRPSVDREINPVGRSVMLRYGYETNKFNPEGEFEIESGVAVPQYSRFVFHRLETQWNEHVPLPWHRHTLTLGVRGAGILGKSVDSFFDFYAGGVLGMKGYPFYALGGNTIATASLTWRFPIAASLNFRVLQFYFTKLYGSFFADYGNAWTGTVPGWADWKTDAGFELRLESFSFYAYPTRFFFSGAYGFDRFEKTFGGVRVQYGKEWRFYFGVLFGFELGDLGTSVHRMLRTSL